MSETHQSKRNPMQQNALCEDEDIGDASTEAELAQVEETGPSRVRTRSPDEEPSLRAIKAPRLASAQEESNSDAAALDDYCQRLFLAQQENIKREARWTVETDKNTRLLEQLREVELRADRAECEKKAVEDIAKVEKEWLENQVASLQNHIADVKEATRVSRYRNSVTHSEDE